MPGIKLKKQDVYEFRYEMTVRVCDLNYGGHVGSTEMTGILHDARVAMLRELGLNELDLGDRATAIVISDNVINYISESRLFDELLVESHIGEIDGSRFRIFQRVSRSDRTVALAETGIVTINLREGKKGPVPQQFIDILENHRQKIYMPA